MILDFGGGNSLKFNSRNINPSQSHFPHSNLDFISSLFSFFPHLYFRFYSDLFRYSLSLNSDPFQIGYRYILVWCLRFFRCALEQKSSAASSSASNLCGCILSLIHPNNSFCVHPIFNTPKTIAIWYLRIFNRFSRDRGGSCDFIFAIAICLLLAGQQLE